MKSEFDICLEPYMTGCLELALGSVDHAMKDAKVAERAREKAEKVQAEKVAEVSASAVKNAQAKSVKKVILEEALWKETDIRTKEDAIEGYYAIDVDYTPNQSSVSPADNLQRSD